MTKRRRLLASVIAVCMILTMVPMSFAAFGATYGDTSGHWAESAIDKWSETGVIQGYEGYFRPDDNITRAEAATVINNVLSYTETSSNTFSDVSSSDWYADAALKLNAAGVLNGNGDGTMAPNANMTREEAATAIARAFSVTSSQAAITQYGDYAQISDWASTYVGAMTGEGYIQGDNGQFRPQDNITRAELITIIDNIVKLYVTSPTQINDQYVPGIVVIKCGGVTGNGLVAKGVVVSPSASGTIQFTGCQFYGNVVNMSPNVELSSNSGTIIDPYSNNDSTSSSGIFFGGGSWGGGSTGGGSTGGGSTGGNPTPTPTAETDYTVTIDFANGDAAVTATYESGAVIEEPAEPTRLNHTFSGWNTERDGSGTAVRFPYTVRGDATIYACYTLNEGVQSIGSISGEEVYYTDGDDMVSVTASGNLDGVTPGETVTVTLTPENEEYAVSGVSGAYISYTDSSGATRTIAIDESAISYIGSGSVNISIPADIEIPAGASDLSLVVVPEVTTVAPPTPDADIAIDPETGKVLNINKSDLKYYDRSGNLQESLPMGYSRIFNGVTDDDSEVSSIRTQTFLVIDLGNYYRINSVKAYFPNSANGGNGTTMVAISNDGTINDRFDIIRTNGSVQSGIPIIDMDTTSQDATNYVEVGPIEPIAVESYEFRYIIIYDWSASASLNELEIYVDTDSMPDPLPTATIAPTPDATTEPTAAPTATSGTEPVPTPDATTEPTAAPTPEATLEPTAAPTTAPTATAEATEPDVWDTLADEFTGEADDYSIVWYKSNGDNAGASYTLEDGVMTITSDPNVDLSADENGVLYTMSVAIKNIKPDTEYQITFDEQANITERVNNGFYLYADTRYTNESTVTANDGNMPAVTDNSTGMDPAPVRNNGRVAFIHDQVVSDADWETQSYTWTSGSRVLEDGETLVAKFSFTLRGSHGSVSVRNIRITEAEEVEATPSPAPTSGTEVSPSPSATAGTEVSPSPAPTENPTTPPEASAEPQPTAPTGITIDPETGKVEGITESNVKAYRGSDATVVDPLPANWGSLFDGDTDVVFDSMSNQQYLVIDLGQEYPISKIRTYFGHDIIADGSETNSNGTMVAVSNNPIPKENGADTYINALRVRGDSQNGVPVIADETDVVSTDSINYLTVGPVTPSGTETAPADENGEYRYVMVYNWSNPGARLNELEIYIDLSGDEPAEPTEEPAASASPEPGATEEPVSTPGTGITINQETGKVENITEDSLSYYRGTNTEPEETVHADCSKLFNGIVTNDDASNITRQTFVALDLGEAYDIASIKAYFPNGGTGNSMVGVSNTLPPRPDNVESFMTVLRSNGTAQNGVSVISSDITSTDKENYVEVGPVKPTGANASADGKYRYIIIQNWSAAIVFNEVEIYIDLDGGEPAEPTASPSADPGATAVPEHNVTAGANMTVDAQTARVGDTVNIETADVAGSNIAGVRYTYEVDGTQTTAWADRSAADQSAVVTDKFTIVMPDADITLEAVYQSGNVARVGSTEYASIAAAVEAAAADSAETAQANPVVITADAYLSEQIWIADNKYVAIVSDGTPHTITRVPVAGREQAGMTVADAGPIFLRNGNVIIGSADGSDDNVSLTFINAEGYTSINPLIGCYTAGNSTNSAVLNPGVAYSNMSRATYGLIADVAKRTTLTVNGGVFSGNSAGALTTETDSAQEQAALFRVRDNTSSLTVNGGIFSDNETNAGVIYTTNAAVAINGGTFEGNKNRNGAGALLYTNRTNTDVSVSISGNITVGEGQDIALTKGNAVNITGALTNAITITPASNAAAGDAVVTFASGVTPDITKVTVNSAEFTAELSGQNVVLAAV
ncbi:MAG TPA: S-layer homology domain-containing protein [Firmicutes bacterium]|nr:S-layer homology domain-containing protein [Bacillota bacterium]